MSSGSLPATTQSGQVQSSAEAAAGADQNLTVQETCAHGCEEQERQALLSICEKFTKEVLDRFVAPQEHVERQLKLYEELHLQLQKQLEESSKSCDLHRQKADLAEQKKLRAVARLEELKAENSDLYRENAALRQQQQQQQNRDAQISQNCYRFGPGPQPSRREENALEPVGQVENVKNETSRDSNRRMRTTQQADKEDNRVSSDLELFLDEE